MGNQVMEVCQFVVTGTASLHIALRAIDQACKAAKKPGNENRKSLRVSVNGETIKVQTRSSWLLAAKGWGL